jgi:hypothetical protein
MIGGARAKRFGNIQETMAAIGGPRNDSNL